MPLNIPPKTNRQPHKGLVGFAIRVCLDACEPAHPGFFVERSLVPNLGYNWWNGAGHISHFVIPLSANSNKSYKDFGVMPRSKIDPAFCSRSTSAQMRNELMEEPATAFQT